MKTHIYCHKATSPAIASTLTGANKFSGLRAALFLALTLFLGLGLVWPASGLAGSKLVKSGPDGQELRKVIQIQQKRSERLLDIVSNPQKVSLKRPQGKETVKSAPNAPDPDTSSLGTASGGSKGTASSGSKGTASSGSKGTASGGNLGAASSGSLLGVVKTNTTKDKANTGTSLGHAICQTARTQMGKPYRSGGISPSTGFDCSGLIYWSFGQHGLKMPRTAREQGAYGLKVERSQLRPGDIVVFKLPTNYHSGIYLGNDKFIHSPSSGKTIREDSVSSTYWSKYYISGRRVIK